MKAPARDHTSPTATTWERPAAWAWILLGGLTVGAFDLLFAMLWWAPLGTSPVRIPQSVAAWLIGRDNAFAGGAATALFGAAVHFYLMTAIVAIYHVASRSRPWLQQHPLRNGMLYGALCYVLIHVIAVPMFSAAPPRRFLLDWSVACLLAHMLLVGVPCALFARRWHSAGD